MRRLILVTVFIVVAIEMGGWAVEALQRQVAEGVTEMREKRDETKI